MIPAIREKPVNGWQCDTGEVVVADYARMTAPTGAPLSDGAGTLVDVLTARAADTPGRLAYSYLPAADSGSDEVTYGQLLDIAAGIAGTVGQIGTAGDRILLLSGLGSHFIGGFVGCMLAGRIPVPVTAPYEPAAAAVLAAVAADCDARAVLAPRSVVDLAEPACAAYQPLARLRWVASDEPAPGPRPDDFTPPMPDDIAFLQYTSGATRSPRGVVVRHANLMHNLAAVQRAYGHSAQTRAVIWLPPHHDMGLIGGVLQPLYAGFPVVLMSPLTLLQNPLSWLRAISEQPGPTTSGGPNFGYSYCVRKVSAAQAAELDLSRWEVAFVGAEPVNPRVLDDFSRHFAPSGFRRSSFTPGYGLAESTLGVSSATRSSGVKILELSVDALEHGRVTEAPGEGRAIVSCGTLLSGSAVIADPDSHQARPPGTIGEVWLSGPSVADGYWGDEDATEAVFRARLAGDPDDETTFLRTGDLGFMHDGELYITGRLTEMIIIRGRNVYPQDIERSIEVSHPELRKGGCAVVSVDADGGERLVVLQEIDRQKPHAPLADIEASIRDVVFRDHALDVHQVIFIEPRQLPKTTSGKIQRVRARAMFLSGRRDSEHTVAELTRWLSRLLGVEPDSLDLGRPLTSLGLDSVKAVELNTYLEQQFSYRVTAEQLFDGLTITSLAAALAVAGAQVSEPAFRAQVSDPAAGWGDQQPSSPGSSAEFSLFFFSSDAEDDATDKYGLFLESAAYADRHGFRAVWTPERHFHRFGGLFPNPSVLSAAIAATTQRIRIRAGSVVLPLHNPVRTAEEWSVVDNLSGGRVDIAFAVGWNPDDFVFAQEAYEARERVMYDSMDRVRRLWRGESIALPNGKGAQTQVRIFPAPVQPELPVWITCSGGAERFKQAGEIGANILTALLFQDVDELRTKLDAYREARAAHGHDPHAGHVTLMLHTLLGADQDSVRNLVEAPFKRYLRDSVDLWRRGSATLDSLSDAEQSAALDFAFERYYHASALFGTPEHASRLVARLVAAGVNEIACLVDFGADKAQVLHSLRYLGDLKDRWAGDRAGHHNGKSVTAAAGTTSRSAGQPGGSGPARAEDLTAALRDRHALAHRNNRGVLSKARDFDLPRRLGEAGLLPFYPDLTGNDGATCWYGDRRLIMLGSNNYLGLTADRRVREATAAAALADGPSVTGSRLMNGSIPAHGDLERKLAGFVGREDALLFTTGYQANIGLLSAFMGAGTVLLADEECHASIYDGAAVSGCRIVQFRHNDVADLDRRLAEDLRSMPAMVMVDGIYSMSGDFAPLPELRAVCDRHGVPLVLDDAHGLGTAGASGRGVEEELGVPGCADILTGTFSKSLASVGGWLAGPRHLMDWVRYYGRSMLFSASIPPPAVAAAAAALDILIAEPDRVTKIRELSAYWRLGLADLGFDTGTSRSAIVPVIIGDELACLRFARRLLDAGVYANCVIAPAVPADRSMMRTTITAVHEKQHLDNALEIFASAGRELGMPR
jgi:8-amino-7-oxononanoate synthase